MNLNRFVNWLMQKSSETEEPDTTPQTCPVLEDSLDAAEEPVPAEPEPEPVHLQPAITYTDNNDPNPVEEAWKQVPAYTGYCGQTFSSTSMMGQMFNSASSYTSVPLSGFASNAGTMYDSHITSFGGMLEQTEAVLNMIATKIAEQGRTGFEVNKNDYEVFLMHDGKAIASGAGDIDIVGPTGTITIHTKNFADEDAERTAAMILAICDNLEEDKKRDEKLRRKLKILSEG